MVCLEQLYQRFKKNQPKSCPIFDLMNKYNPIIQQNASWIITTIVNDATGHPIDLTNWTGESSIKAHYNDTTILLHPTITITNPTYGELTISLTDVQTATLRPTPPQPCKHPLPVWDVLIANADRSIVYRILEGFITVLPGVTQWV
jgi:hypothetical protein